MFCYRPSKNKFIGSKLDILMPWGQEKIYKLQNSEKVSRFQVYVTQKLSMTEERRQIKAVCSDEITGKKNHNSKKMSWVRVRVEIFLELRN
jgi:hypothetical protein